MVLEFFCRSQLDLMRLCITCGCPDDLNMNMARLVNMLNWAY